MNPQVALLIANLVCTDPVQPFREFYGRYYMPPTLEGRFRLGQSGEPWEYVFPRVADAIGDYADYRAARATMCGGAR